MRGIKLSLRSTRPEVAKLHAAFAKLGHRVSQDEIQRGVVEDSTRAAIRALQTRAGLAPDGDLSVATIAALDTELAHAFFAQSKTRTFRIHEMLTRVGLQLDTEEVEKRRFGPSTAKAIAEFRRRGDLRVTEHVDDELYQRLETAALRARLASKTQTAKLQRKLLHAARIAKIDAQIDRDELRDKRVGPTTTTMLQAFQRRYHLPATGVPDVATIQRLDSVAASRRRPAAPRAPARSVEPLAPIARNARLNMTGAHVERLQRGLVRLGFAVEGGEVAAREFGRSTREAVLAFERRHALPLTGHVAGKTRKRLEAEIAASSSAAAAIKHHVRGSVRDALWRGRTSVRVQLVEKTLSGGGSVLAERRTTSTGFYDLPYDPPSTNGRANHLVVRIVNDAGAVLNARDLFNPTPIAWSNFTAGSGPYRGSSEFGQRMDAVVRVLGTKSIESIEESAAKHEVSYVAQHAQLLPEEVMRLVLAHRCATRIADAAIVASVLYAFVRLNRPPGLPSDLLLATERWTLIGQLVELIAEGVVFMEETLQAATFDGR